MKFGKRHHGPAEPDPGQQAVRELLDRYHQRASISGDGHLVMEPGKVLANVAFAMERVDTDIDTPVSIEEDVAPLQELVTMVRVLQLGRTLAVHVVNTAMKIMSARYPAELVHRPLPPEYDLRKLQPVTLTDQQHETAKEIFNRRSVSAADLTEDDVPEMDVVDWQGQVQVFVPAACMPSTAIPRLRLNASTYPLVNTYLSKSEPWIAQRPAEHEYCCNSDHEPDRI